MLYFDLLFLLCGYKVFIKILLLIRVRLLFFVFVIKMFWDIVSDKLNINYNLFLFV